MIYKDYDKARVVLDMYWLPSSSWNEKRIDGEVKSRLAKSQRLLEEVEAEREKQTEDIEKIRSLFDGQTAALMAHFKFQIDTSTMRATIYAHLVARHNDEIKAIKKAMKKKWFFEHFFWRKILQIVEKLLLLWCRTRTDMKKYKVKEVIKMHKEDG